MNKPLIVDLPYPTLKEEQKDIKSAYIISPAYASRHGELMAILQYNYQGYFLEEDSEIAKVLNQISIAEMKHLNILGQTLLKLGVDPIYTRVPPFKYDYFVSDFVSYSKTLQKIIMDDITGELVAIKDYEEMLVKLQNEKVSAIISRIKLDEELHVKVLKNLLEQICEQK